MSENTPHPNAASSFRTTRWTKIVTAKGCSIASRQALEELCEAYYRPIESFIRWRVKDPVLTKDLTQEFFADFLNRKSFGQADREKGKFRSYLLGAVNHFLSDHFKAQSRKKRGGGATMVLLDAPQQDSDTSSIELPDPNQKEPELLFDREWAFTLLDRALTELQKEESSKGREKPFAILKPWLTGALGDQAQSEASEALGLSPNATKVAIHRLRKRFRQQVQAEISHTVNHPSEIEGELNYLKQIIAS